MKLKSTGQRIYKLGWTATADKPWNNGYERIVIPAPNKFHKHSVQIVRKSSIDTD